MTALDAATLAEVRRSRRHPRPTQFDYLHIRRLVTDLRRALSGLDGDVRDVLDVYCGSRPYDDLLPAGARCTSMDVVGNPYGVADLVTNEFLPFPDASFDLVTCFEAFHYVEDPRHGVGELRRVLRPGGAVLVSVPFVWEYDRTILEHRYTGPELADLFRDWDRVRVVENGGRAIAWATLTGSLLMKARDRLPSSVHVAFSPLFLALNACGAALDRLEQGGSGGAVTLPMNLLVTAERPADA